MADTSSLSDSDSTLSVPAFAGHWLPDATPTTHNTHHIRHTLGTTPLNSATTTRLPHPGYHGYRSSYYTAAAVANDGVNEDDDNDRTTMSQIATEVPRDSRDPGPSTTPPSTRYAPQAAAARAPIAASANVAGNQVSMQAALTAANGNLHLALETILNERNTLSSQNSQLWKIIEKQRGMYNSLHKELDRVKAERDRLQSRPSGESSTKRPSGGDSTSKKQVIRSQSEDRRESHLFALLFWHL